MRTRKSTGTRVCACGKPKDYRAKRCAVCAGVGFAVSKKGVPVRSKSAVTSAATKSRTIKETAERLGVKRSTAKKLLDYFSVNVSHFMRVRYREYTAEQILRKDSKATPGTLRKFLRQHASALVPYACACGQQSVWCGQELVLQLHHKNGDRHDNRTENLEFVCPNCHSQTNTYTGRNCSGKQKGKRRARRW